MLWQQKHAWRIDLYTRVSCFRRSRSRVHGETEGRIRKIAEELDAHRKRAQEKHIWGLTDIYNVLEKLRAVDRRTAWRADSVSAAAGTEPGPPGGHAHSEERAIHDAALVSTLKQLHDDLEPRWPTPTAGPGR